MRSCNALSLTSWCTDWLTNSRHPRILHVFERACNLINEHREVLSIVMPEIGSGPFNLVIPRLRNTFDNLNLRSPVSTFATQLIVGNLAINITHAKCWNPSPDWEALHARREILLHQLITALQEQWCPARSNFLTKSGITSRGLAMPEITKYPFSNSLISSLFIALAHADVAPAATFAFQLAGLGSGLTPAGDDFMTGAIYAAWIIHPVDIARVLAEEIANTAAPLTTSLSAAWLRSAGRGEAGILWHDFFTALTSLGSTQIGDVMDKILAVGETSGADALAGFVGSFVAWMQKAGTANG